ncbi:glycosyltransferase family 1 protein [Hypholoma sublateritium FD-334 SS-4]|uniref:Glycosyltransferase family 1 protein n=1 Tax=Hypholoma sublateritium (strain FD-334 SS-4) TaxID=945553 RepID=A0A0D2L4E5_HYPSF|nr:glycosyltransferase family 1 protein [Hypholoma sublateritium FD-334 SS-4]
MAVKDASHLLLAPFPAWGHIRPLCHLALRFLELDNKIMVTILIGPNFFAKARAEILANSSISLERNAHIRILTTFQSTDQDVFKLMGPLISTYSEAYKTLQAGQEVTCATTGVTYDAVKAPVAALLDFFLGPIVVATRALGGESIRIFAWATGAPAAITRMWGPEYLGGLGDFEAKVEAEAQRTGGVAADIGFTLFRETTGAIVQLPSLPPMYDHEFFPQGINVMQNIYQLLVGGHDAFKNSNGIVLSSSYASDRKAIEGIKTWFAETPKEVYGVGPLLPRTYWDIVPTDEGATDVRNFLNEMQARHGTKSVILVSFGTFFWPPVQEYVDEIIMNFIDKKFPFILCHPSSFSNIPQELSNLVKSSGIGIISSWVPQLYVLNHPATGWFLTHGGQGSVTEALGSGTPMICFPIDGDQPVLSVQAAHTLRVAFELVEVRTGHGLKPLHRLGGRKPEGTRTAVGCEIREVIDDMRGDAGKELRRNAEAVKTEMQKSWAEGGTAKKELTLLLEKMTVV